MVYNIYTDGSSKGKNQVGCGAGGWAYIVVDENNQVLGARSGSVCNTTNQRMELLAALSALTEYADGADCINLYSDSAYLINCSKQKWHIGWVNNGWRNSKREEVKNRDLWEQLIPYLTNPKIKFIKVKGHAGNKFNEEVDTLAQRGADSALVEMSK